MHAVNGGGSSNTNVVLDSTSHSGNETRFLKPTVPPWPYRLVSAGGFGVGFAVGFRRKAGANPTAKSVSTWVCSLQSACCR